MASVEQPRAASDAEQDFVLSRRDVIHEGNWAVYEAQGFVSLPNAGLLNEVRSAQITYGVENVYTGDKWDYGAKRPLRHKPGRGIYIHPDGLAYAARRKAEQDSRDHAAAGPEAS